LSGTEPASRGQDPLPQAPSTSTTPTPKPETRNEAAVLEEIARETTQPAPIVTIEVLINEGVGQDEGKGLVVADQH
jgi:hypothetical protein